MKKHLQDHNQSLIGTLPGEKKNILRSRPWRSHSSRNPLSERWCHEKTVSVLTQQGPEKWKACAKALSGLIIGSAALKCWLCRTNAVLLTVHMLLHEGLDQSDDLHSRGNRPRIVWKVRQEILQKLKQAFSNSKIPELGHFGRFFFLLFFFLE